MAISQSISSFFLPSRRRRIPTPPYAPQAAPVVESLNSALAVVDSLDVSDEVKKNFETDLKDAFMVRADRRPGYEPGKGFPTGVNLIDLATKPIKTIQTTLEKSFDMGLPALNIAWAKTDEEVWQDLFKSGWVDDQDRRVDIPISLQQAILRWNEATGVRGSRIAANQHGIMENPGLVFVMARRLNLHYSAIPGATYDENILGKISNFQKIGEEAEKYVADIEGALARGDWASADEIQKKWAENSRPYRDSVIQEFEFLSRDGNPLANTPEARFWRYRKLRDLHYSTLNILSTYKKDGLSGVAREYVWKSVIKSVFTENKGSLRYYLYPPHAIVKIQEETIGRLLKPVLNQLTKVQTWAKKIWSQTAGKFFKKALRWLGEKLGLKALGAVIGSALPVAGTAAGAIIGAVIQFAGELAIKKIVVPVFKIIAYSAAAAFFFMVGTVGIVVFIAIVLSNTPYPWETAALEIDCNQSATATSSCVLPKATVKGVADHWGVGPGNHVNECYSDVIAKSKAAGVDPRLAMATWLNESNASNYEMYERLGEPPQDFGIPAQAGNGFTAQITSFLNFVKQSKVNYPACYQGQSQAAGFYRAFCTVGREEFGVGTCSNLTDQGKKCVAKYLNVYSFVNAGGQCN